MSSGTIFQVEALSHSIIHCLPISIKFSTDVHRLKPPGLSSAVPFYSLLYSHLNTFLLFLLLFVVGILKQLSLFNYTVSFSRQTVRTCGMEVVELYTFLTVVWRVKFLLQLMKLKRILIVTDTFNLLTDL